MSELNNSMDFETAYAKLREVVTQLEDPKNKIEDNIALYEQACKLVLYCRRKLEETGMKITQINERVAKMKNSEKIFED